MTTVHLQGRVRSSADASVAISCLVAQLCSPSNALLGLLALSHEQRREYAQECNVRTCNGLLVDNLGDELSCHFGYILILQSCKQHTNSSSYLHLIKVYTNIRASITFCAAGNVVTLPGHYLHD